MRPLVYAALLLVACGSDSDNGSATERITQVAYQQACSEAEDFLVSRYSGDYFVQALCTAAAVEGTSDAQTCGQQLDDCINSPPPEIQAGIDAILDQGGCSLLSVNTATCSSTLGEIKACLDAIDGEVSSVKYTLTCAAAGQTLDDWDLVSVPSECQFASDC